MWSFLKSINQLRYLCVWRVNRALIRRPKHLPTDLSRIVGTIIAERLPTAEARAWHKSLNPKTPNPGSIAGQTMAYPGWPVESVLFAYPGKRLYGPGQLIFWELKLLGEQADHSFFLEVILPAMEAASQTTDSRWYGSNMLWGRFDVHAIYVARGLQWEPLVSDGRLNTRYRPNPLQWAKDLSFTPPTNHHYQQLNWLTPIDLRNIAAAQPAKNQSPQKKKPLIPTMPLLLDALLARLAQLLPGKYTTPADVWDMMLPDEQDTLWEAVAQANQLKSRNAPAESKPHGWPYGWLGEQKFKSIPPSIVPYLELASILHLGQQTHLGCGTFTF